MTTGANKAVGKERKGKRHFFPTEGKTVVADDIKTARKQAGVKEPKEDTK